MSCLCDPLFCDDHQKTEDHVANKEMVTPLHNLLELDSFWLGFSFRATTMYYLVFRFSFEILSTHYDTILPASWCV